MNVLALQYQFEYNAGKTLAMIALALIFVYVSIIALTILHIAKTEEDTAAFRSLTAQVATQEITYLAKTRELDAMTALDFGLVAVTEKHYRPANTLSLSVLHAQ